MAAAAVRGNDSGLFQVTHIIIIKHLWSLCLKGFIFCNVIFKKKMTRKLKSLQFKGLNFCDGDRSLSE